MLTVRQIERLWNANDYARLARELLAGRAEFSVKNLLDASARTPSAAWALIRIDEFAQSSHPLAARLMRALLAHQDPDGGWADAPTTALVLRALSTCNGHGLAVDRGVTYLANLQKPDGTWPRIPIRRTESDADASATIRAHLAHVPAARVLLEPALAITAPLFAN